MIVTESEGDDPGGEAEGQEDEGEADPDDGAGLALPAPGLVLTHGELDVNMSDVNTEALQI